MPRVNAETTEHQPTIPAATKCAEFTLKAALLGIALAVLLAISNTFLALKIGVLTASSIPAAMLSMAVLRLFKTHTILENNLVQTCASSGEAIAGGIVYTAPALIIIHAWTSFSFELTFFLTWIGGMLGVFLIVPLRRRFMRDKDLRFPEAQAISQVLIAGTKKAVNIMPLVIAAVLGALFEVAQNALKILADSASLWISKGQVVWGFGVGFSATLIGAGYLTGAAVCGSVFIGAVLSHLFLMPLISYHDFARHLASPWSWHVSVAVQQKLAYSIRYVGIGAMLTAGLLTLLQLLKPFYNSILNVFSGNNTAAANHKNKKNHATIVARTDRDMPRIYVFFGCALFYAMAFAVFHHVLSSHNSILHLNLLQQAGFALALVLFVALFGYIFAVICAYFSGLVGVTASPGSSVAIATILLATLAISFVGHFLQLHASASTPVFMALTVMLTCMVMGSACVANNNSQDLKVGYSVGATPWKQQLMLLIGVSVASCVVPYVMQLLLNAYGIVGVHLAGQTAAGALAAPPAAAMAAIAEAAFSHQLPLAELWYGVIAIAVFFLLKILLGSRCRAISLIGIAIGIYLPLTASMPLCIGGLVSYLAQRQRQTKTGDIAKSAAEQRGVLISCGLVAGAAVMNVILAVPASLAWHGMQLRWGGAYYMPITEILAALATIMLARYLYKQAS